MSGTYKVIELVGISPVSFAEAVKSAVAEASKTIRHMDWFEMVNERGSIVDGKVAEFQVTLKVGFKIERWRYRQRPDNYLVNVLTITPAFYLRIAGVPIAS
jgi:flavin-binding protein dodecin